MCFLAPYCWRMKFLFGYGGSNIFTAQYFFPSFWPTLTLTFNILTIWSQNLLHWNIFMVFMFIICLPIKVWNIFEIQIMDNEFLKISFLFYHSIFKSYISLYDCDIMWFYCFGCKYAIGVFELLHLITKLYIMCLLLLQRLFPLQLVHIFSVYKMQSFLSFFFIF